MSPIACDPLAVRRFVLRADRAKPEPRPRFFLKTLTRRQKMNLVGSKELNEATIRQLGSDETFRIIYQVLAAVLTGWEHLTRPDDVPVDYPLEATDPANLAVALSVLDTVLTEREIWELYFAAVGDLDKDDLKNFGLPSSGPPGTAAPAAPAS